jgi:hypothetical protein
MSVIAQLEANRELRHALLRSTLGKLVQIRHFNMTIVTDIMIPSLRNLVNCRLTVSIVRPRKSAMSDRVNGNSKFAESGSASGLICAAIRIQETGDFLGCGFPAQCQHPVTRLVQLLQRLLEQPMFKLRSLFDHPVNHGLGETAEIDLGGRVRGYSAVDAKRAAEKIWARTGGRRSAGGHRPSSWSA